MTEEKQELAFVSRMFDRGAGKNGSFDLDPYIATRFAKRKEQIGSFFDSFKNAEATLFVVTNIDEKSPLCEKTFENGETPTSLSIKKCFPNKVADGKIRFLACGDWGRNTGSTNALNIGFKTAFESGFLTGVTWSPELHIDENTILEAIEFMKKKNLIALGLVREGWFLRTQHNVYQNTGALVDISFLLTMGGFNPRCNGTGEKIIIHGHEDLGEMEVAGMEDFYFMLESLKRFGKNFNWGMFGNKKALPWDTKFEDPARELDHAKKIARQYEVMKLWTREIFPDEPFEDVWGRLFQNYHLD